MSGLEVHRLLLRVVWRSHGLWLFFFMVVVGFLLIVRSVGLYPTVFGDEYIFSHTSRLVPAEAAPIPSYLYNWIYRSTNICGDAFLVCARFENVLFFVLAAPLIFMSCRRVAGPGTALAVVALTLLGSTNSYTAYFMPESLYFLCFWIFTFAILDPAIFQNNLRKMVAGVALGAATLVKPHALFLFPAVALYLTLARNPYVVQNRLWDRIFHVALVLGCALAVKWGIGWSAAGPAGLTVFGRFYGETLVRANWVQVFRLALSNLPAHILALLTFYAVATASLVVILRRRTGSSSEYNLALYTLFVIASLIGVTVLFTASVAGSGPFETIRRVHMRYYSFALPLMLIIVATQVNRRQFEDKNEHGQGRARWVFALLAGAGLLYAGIDGFKSYDAGIVDGPDLWVLSGSGDFLYVLLSLSAASLGMWAWSPVLGGRAFLYVLTPVFVCCSLIEVTSQMWIRREPDFVDNAGMLVRRYLSDEERSRILIVGSGPSERYRALFYVDSTRVSFAQFAHPETLPDIDWVLTLGDHRMTCGATPQIVGHFFSLERLRWEVDFTKINWPQALDSADGLQRGEAGRAWSTTDHVELKFATPLPASFKAKLTASAFGPNVGKLFWISSGHSRRGFVLGSERSELTFEFENSAGADSLRVEVPDPTAPKSLSLSDDSRLLGIAMERLEITPLPSMANCLAGEYERASR